MILLDFGMSTVVSLAVGAWVLGLVVGYRLSTQKASCISTAGPPHSTGCCRPE